MKEFNNIDVNREFQIALSFINETDKNVFVTGKAGTGKTTFLKHFTETTFKKAAVVAPTGIAAISASGVTVHSLFGLPITPFFPGRSEIRDNLNTEKRTLLRQMELLVFDEVSMLRADVLDATDTVLRDVRSKPELPFGGVQVVYIGDLYQLSPIATAEEWNQLKNYYESPYFISAKVFKEATPIIVNLEKIYRQKDEEFISVLNAIREGKCNATQIELLNKCCQQGVQSKEGYVTLSTHNSSVDSVNSKKLAEINGQVVNFTADISGEFDEGSFPTEKVLQLKEGAQIMILRNDSSSAKKYYNGRLGIIERIENEKLLIKFSDEEHIELQKETWKNIKYEFDAGSGKILAQEIGSFCQFPIRLAWAITIHKSQGLTFDRAILDVSKVFAPGQAYVAFSRIRSLDGLILNEFVSVGLINNNANVVDGLMIPDDGAVSNLLDVSRKDYAKRTITKIFDWAGITGWIEENQSNLSDYESLKILAAKTASWQDISAKFDAEVKVLIQSTDWVIKLDNRVKAACAFFFKEMDTLHEDVLAKEYKRTKDSINQRLIFRFIKGTITLLKAKRKELEMLTMIIKRLSESKNFTDILSASINNGQEEINVGPMKKHEGVGNLMSMILALYREGDSLANISMKTKVSIPTVENHLADFVTTGELNVLDLIDASKLRELVSYLQADQLISIFEVKQKMGKEISFGQIKAAINYQKLIDNAK